MSTSSFDQLLSTYDYSAAEVFDLERGTIFRDSWQFACMAHEVAAPDDFVTLDIGGLPVVLQNMSGELKAFENVCSHRFARIQREERGNRPLVCSYHAFCYDGNGCPTPPPRLGLQLTVAQRESMRLREYRVERCGELVFVNINPSRAPALSEYLGATGEHLLLCGRGMGDLIERRQEQIAANWKVVVENFLEFAHIPTVHQATFGRIGLDGSAGITIELLGLHSAGLLKADVQRLASGSGPEDLEYLSSFQRRPFQPMGSHVSLIYPNLIVVSVFGLSYLFTSVRPLSRNETLLEYRLYEAKPDEGTTIRPELRHRRREVLKAFAYKTVIEEDKGIVELLQRGCEVTSKPGILGALEERVHHFQQNVISSRSARG